MFEYMLGYTYKDRIKDFQGVCTGVCTYITGCSQALISPPTGENMWFDIQRLVLVEEVEKVAIDNGYTPGCDTAAPIR